MSSAPRASLPHLSRPTDSGGFQGTCCGGSPKSPPDGSWGCWGHATGVRHQLPQLRATPSLRIFGKGSHQVSAQRHRWTPQRGFTADTELAEGVRGNVPINGPISQVGSRGLQPSPARSQHRARCQRQSRQFRPEPQPSRRRHLHLPPPLPPPLPANNCLQLQTRALPELSLPPPGSPSVKKTVRAFYPRAPQVP